MNRKHSSRHLRGSAMALVLVVLCVGCAKDSMPDPTVPAIQEMVVNIALDLIRDLVLPEAAEQATGITAITIQAYGYPPLEYKAWLAKADESEGIAKAVAIVDEHVSVMSPVLVGVRIDAKEPTLHRVTCLADLALGTGAALHIRYQVQFTEDDNVYVQVEILS